MDNQTSKNIPYNNNKLKNNMYTFENNYLQYLEKKFSEMNSDLVNIYEANLRDDTENSEQSKRDKEYVS